jgi:hypothetical protein
VYISVANISVSERRPTPYAPPGVGFTRIKQKKFGRASMSGSVSSRSAVSGWPAAAAAMMLGAPAFAQAPPGTPPHGETFE